MKKVSEGLNDISIALNDLSRDINSKKGLERIHKENQFNRRFSSVLDCYSDFQAVGNRLEENIAEAESLYREIRSRERGKDASISEEIQQLSKRVDKISQGNRADFKCLYTFGKVFLDQYTSLIRFLFDWRGIGDRSITHFFNDLQEYDGNEEQIISFKETCLRRLIAIDVFVTQYRDKYIVHNQGSHKETRWFLTEMNGTIRFFGGRSSITPQELLFVVSNYIVDSVNFIKVNIQVTH